LVAKNSLRKVATLIHVSYLTENYTSKEVIIINTMKKLIAHLFINDFATVLLFIHAYMITQNTVHIAAATVAA